ncbi:STAS domain-containing protein [Streptomyces sp. NPDC048111]|uniref:STAS domain-containing protein n=1 Tax=Streptomyces sp. NPDC048111 TaxID=3365500 RepID=UPI00370FD83E
MAETETTGTEHSRQPEQLSVTTTDADGVRVVTVAGEIDHDSGGPLRRTLTVTDASSLRTVVDLHQVTFMDSSGINILIHAHTELSAAGGWLRLAAPTTTVMRTLSIVGVDTVIDCRTTLEQALVD